MAVRLFRPVLTLHNARTPLRRTPREASGIDNCPRARIEQLEGRRLLSGYILQSLAPFGPVPNGDLAMDANGNLFGTTQRGGLLGLGIVFEYVKGSTTPTPIATFNGKNGVAPVGGLVLDANGDLFGTTAFTSLGGPFVHSLPNPTLGVGGAGDGTIFEVVKGSGIITTLATFNGSNGSDPQGALVMDASGDLFGTTWKGGTNNDGTIFELPHGSNTITLLATLNGTDGKNPVTGLLQDANGNLFGTAELGGANNDGTIFELAQGSGSITLLASFDGTDGALPMSSLLMDGSGNLFGSASSGGANGVGTVMELPQGSSTMSVLASFDGVNGASPRGSMVLDGSGDLFGTTHVHGAANDGNAFEIVSGSNAVTVLASFNGDSGAFPQGLIADSSGDLFGATQSGALNGHGSVFRLLPGATAANPGTLTATVVRTTLPPSVIAGTNFDTTGIPSQFASISLTDGALLNATLRVTIYASSDQAIDSSSVLIATAAPLVNEPAHQPFGLTIPILRLPASLPAGFYSLLVQAVDQFGNTANATMGAGLEVVAPTIALSEAFTSLTLPAAILSGANTGSAAVFKVTNRGNIPSMGPITMALYASPDGTVASGTLITITSRNPIIPPGTSALVGVPLGTIPLGLNGNYFIVAKFTDPQGNVTSVASSSTFAISAPVVTLAAAIDSFTPTTLPASSRTSGSVIVTLSNSGNVPAGGSSRAKALGLTLGLVSQDGTQSKSLESFTLPVVLGPGVSRTFRLAFKVSGLSGILAGTYFPTLTVVAGGTNNTASTTGTVPVAVA